MREISQHEVQMVSGAGLTEIIGGLTTAMDNVSTALQTTVESISAATDSWTIRGLTHKALSLSRAYAKLSFLSSILTSLNSTTDTTTTA
ncbi:hypothetical protein [Kalamiella sp. sgz302252]|uniref:hypothetical protein n=1 Tax=Pantoea sp. sgz302252 TaxID=3341827 RepID=UPI0036D3E5E6